MGQTLDGRALGYRYRICTAPLIQFYDVANTSLILEISIHLPGKGQEPLEYGNHGSIKEIPTPADVIGTLEAEFNTQRGRIMVSGESRPSILNRSYPMH